jgi:hypothetical protein
MRPDRHVQEEDARERADRRESNLRAIEFPRRARSSPRSPTRREQARRPNASERLRARAATSPRNHRSRQSAGLPALSPMRPRSLDPSAIELSSRSTHLRAIEACAWSQAGVAGRTDYGRSAAAEAPRGRGPVRFRPAPSSLPPRSGKGARAVRGPACRARPTRRTAPSARVTEPRRRPARRPQVRSVRLIARRSRSEGSGEESGLGVLGASRRSGTPKSAIEHRRDRARLPTPAPATTMYLALRAHEPGRDPPDARLDCADLDSRGPGRELALGACRAMRRTASRAAAVEHRCVRASVPHAGSTT